MPIQLAQRLLALLDPRVVERGRAYALQGRVESFEAQELGPRIVGTVHGSEAQSYRVQVRPSANGRSIDATCTCPVGGFCKHVAAVLLATLGEHGPAKEAGTPRLDALTDRWLRSLAPAQALLPATHPDKAYLYILSAAPKRQTVASLQVAVVETTPRKDGRGWAKGRHLGPGELSGLELPRADAVLVASFAAFRPESHYYGETNLAGEGAQELLQRLVDTGRAYWGSTAGAPLGWGETLSGRWQWEVRDDESLLLHLQLERPSLILLATQPLSYVDPLAARVGPVDAQVSSELADRLLAGPPLPFAGAAEVAERLGPVLAKLPVPLPHAPELVELEAEAPQLRLHWTGPAPSLDTGAPGWRDHPRAEVRFVYGAHSVPTSDTRPTMLIPDGARYVRLRRRLDDEERLLQRLRRAHFVPAREVTGRELLALNPAVSDDPWVPNLAPKDLDARLPVLLGQLSAAGVELSFAEGFAYGPALEPEAWWAELVPQAETGWYAAELGVEIDGQRVSLMPALLAALGELRGLEPARLLERLETKSLDLGGGRRVRLPRARLQAILGLIVALHERPEGVAELAPLAAAELAVDPAWRVHSTGELPKLVAALPTLLAPPAAALPKGLDAELRDYQRRGLGWLTALAANGLGGILADDMGLGKTVQAIAFILSLRAQQAAPKPTLVVMPTSLIPNWQQELARFAPGLRVATLHGAARHQQAARLGQADVILTTYALAARDSSELQSRTYGLLLLDEAQAIKNVKTLARSALAGLRAEVRVCMTGTPIENHLGELWSQLDFVMPGFLGSAEAFNRTLRGPIERQGSAVHAQYLARRCKPFILRRLKGEVAAELPPRSESTLPCELAGEQRDMYEAVRATMDERVRAKVAELGLKRSSIVILDALLKLRQVCCDPRLVAGGQGVGAPSAKLELLMELVPSLVEDGRRILLFSQFTGMLDLIEAELEAQGLASVRLDGSTQDRATPVRRFQAGEVPLFLLSLKAGGAGLNLTAADAVIHYDPWWNPAAEQQATDRAHRIGQDKTVFVYRLVAAGTVEERIVALQQRKRALAAGVLDHREANLAAELSETDLHELFLPIGAAPAHALALSEARRGQRPTS